MKKLTDSKTTGHLNIAFFTAILISLILAGCTSTQKSAGKKLTTQDFTLTYIDKAQASGEIGDLTLKHPLSISERQMVFHMVALRYENYSLFNKPGPVFTREDIQKTKRLLTKALNKAHAQNIIKCEVKSESGTTKGQLFVSGEKLHWQFFKIQGVDYSLTRNQMARYGTAWQLVPGNGQGFHTTSKLLGTKKWTNWIEAKINLPAPKNLKAAGSGKQRAKSGATASKPPPLQPSAPKKNPADLEEKLKFLKHLHENQLIDKREYEQKRKDLLDQYL